jgi:hypothetical protein
MLSYPIEFIILGICSQLRYTQQFTVWNLILSGLQPFLNIPPQSLLLNSATTWIGFQYGATNGTKHKLMKKSRITNIPLFLLLDICGHLLPAIVWGYVVLKNKQQITNVHLLRQSAWVAMFYIFVGKGFNCEKQYTVYPYMRQVFQAATAPSLIQFTFNSLLCGNVYPMLGFATYLWYGKDYLDLSDESNKSSTV